MARITAVEKLQAELDDIGEPWEKVEIKVGKGKYKYVAYLKLSSEEITRQTSINEMRVALNWFYRKKD